jgi:hypothetical protein
MGIIMTSMDIELCLLLAYLQSVGRPGHSALTENLVWFFDIFNNWGNKKCAPKLYRFIS